MVGRVPGFQQSLLSFWPLSRINTCASTIFHSLYRKYHPAVAIPICYWTSTVQFWLYIPRSVQNIQTIFDSFTLTQALVDHTFVPLSSSIDFWNYFSMIAVLQYDDLAIFCSSLSEIKLTNTLHIFLLILILSSQETNNTRSSFVARSCHN